MAWTNAPELNAAAGSKKWLVDHRYDANLLGPHLLGELHVMQGQLDKAEQHIRQPLKAAKTGNALLLLGDLCFIKNETQLTTEPASIHQA